MVLLAGRRASKARGWRRVKIQRCLDPLHAASTFWRSRRACRISSASRCWRRSPAPGRCVSVRSADGREARGLGGDATERRLGLADDDARILPSRRSAQSVHLPARRGVCQFWRSGHPLEIGLRVPRANLDGRCSPRNRQAYPDEEPLPYLGGLVCLSAFDLALYDAFGIANGLGCSRASAANT